MEVAREDVNFDGKFNVIVTRTDGKVTVAFGDGAGRSCTFADYFAGASPGSLAIGEFDHDGPPDLAIAKTTPDEVVILRNLGTGTCLVAGTVPITGVLASVRAARFDGDPNLDLVVPMFLVGLLL